MRYLEHYWDDWEDKRFFYFLFLVLEITHELFPKQYLFRPPARAVEGGETAASEVGGSLHPGIPGHGAGRDGENVYCSRDKCFFHRGSFQTEEKKKGTFAKCLTNTLIKVLVSNKIQKENPPEECQYRFENLVTKCYAHLEEVLQVIEECRKNYSYTFADSTTDEETRYFLLCKEVQRWPAQSHAKFACTSTSFGNQSKLNL
ncbi:hypothetical protein CEXT_223671 [Caerostris extrusa]|uniref:GCK domain-containing protein n=1 Tax=Caerostris extrusa TaxID=172846 RepID=A0AAV4XX81_CAEEX|nr:hypothetical protein CEXT_223671 [Caerostris extrusa]